MKLEIQCQMTNIESIHLPLFNFRATQTQICANKKNPENANGDDRRNRNE